jgi:putative ABC transport system permease protein
MGTSFGVDGTVITSDLNFARIVPQVGLARVSIGVVRLAAGANPEAVQAALRARLPHDVKILTRQEMLDAEVAYWARATPIGFVFTFGVLMGLVVGMIIVYQILFADISDHLKEYATLKAIGYTDRYLSGIVVTLAMIMSGIGYIPAVVSSLVIYAIIRNVTVLPVAMTESRLISVLAITLVMSVASALFALRVLRRADPMDLFAA